MADVSISLELQAKQLYDDLSRVQTNLASFAAQAVSHGEKASTGFAAGFRSRLSSLTSGVTGALGTLGIGIGAGAIAAEMKAVIDKAHEIHHEAERFGLDAEQLQLIGNAAQEEGIPLSMAARALNLMQINSAGAAEGTGKVAEALNRLGIDATQFAQLNVQQKFLLLSDAYRNSAKDGQAYADVATIIGKRNTEMIPILDKGSAAIKRQGQEMGIISTKSVNDLNTAYKTLQIVQGKTAVGFAESASGLKTLYEWLGKVADKTPLVGGARRELGISGANQPASELAITPPPEALAPAGPPETPISELPLSPDATEQELADKYVREQGFAGTTIDKRNIDLRQAAQIQRQVEDQKAAVAASEAAGAFQPAPEGIATTEKLKPDLEGIRRGEIEAGMQRAFAEQEMNIANWAAGEELLTQIRDAVGRGNL